MPTCPLLSPSVRLCVRLSRSGSHTRTPVHVHSRKQSNPLLVQSNPPLDDTQQTFWLAETLKYLYLLFRLRPSLYVCMYVCMYV